MVDSRVFPRIPPRFPPPTAARSGGRALSFELLAGDSSGDDGSLRFPTVAEGACDDDDGNEHHARRRRKPKGSKRKKKKRADEVAVAVGECLPSGLDGGWRSPRENGGLVEEARFSAVENRSVVEAVCESSVVEREVSESSQVSCVSFAELRQRNVNGVGLCDGSVEEEANSRESSTGQWRPASNGGITVLKKEKSLDWKRVMAEHPDVSEEVTSAERSPLRYFMGEVYDGNSLRSTISVGNDKKRQRVYNTMFHVPWRCEWLIVAGFFVCLDSFLSLVTIMPARILMSIWRILNRRQFHRPDATELSDFGCLIVLACGVIALQLTDISLIYHIIRGQGTVKLYVVYNVLEIFDKLLQSFDEDVLQVLFNSADGLATCAPDSITFGLIRFIFDQIIAIMAFTLHSFILLAQAITLSTCIVAHNNALLALLVSNNFAEIKSNVFKRVSKDNLHSLVHLDIIERFHISASVLFVLAQNILEAEGSWFGSFVTSALLVYMCEIFIDATKHSFLAKFNEIKPVAYAEFLEDLCKQTLNIQSEDGRKNLNFIPLAPACVVIRVLTPIYATALPYGPLPWRLLWILFWSALTYIILAICKILVGITLNCLATWYINQRLERKHHAD